MSEILRNIPIEEKLARLPEDMRDWAKEGLEIPGGLKKEELDNRPFLDYLHSRWAVGGHETGHEHMAKVEDWFVDGISITPEGNTLGYTRIIPNPNHSTEKIFTSRIAICYGGEAAEEILGIYDHRGCGSDRAQARYAQAFLGRAGVISEQRSYAHSSVGSFGRRYFSQKAWGLVRAA